MASSTFLQIAEAVDNFPYHVVPGDSYYSLYLPCDDAPHGYLHPAVVDKMPWTARFRVEHERGGRRVTVVVARDDVSQQGLDDPEAMSAAVNAAFAELIGTCIDRRLFHVLSGMHSEPISVVGAPYPVQLERFAGGLFGITNLGAAMVAYTYTTKTTTTIKAGQEEAAAALIDSDTPSREMKIWVPRRAAHLYTYPGHLDVTVAGGVRTGETPTETLVHEADEEASLPESLVRSRARSRGTVSYVAVTTASDAGFPGEKGLVVPVVVYVYDMELRGEGEGETPRPQDDEVEGFALMGVVEVQDAVRRGEFKPDAALILLDFMVRHGIITPENEPDYGELCGRLRRRVPFRTAPPRAAE